MHSLSKGVRPLSPSVRSPLQPLDLVLSDCQKPLFNNIRDIPLFTCSEKVAIFGCYHFCICCVCELAAFSCELPYLILQRIKVFLHLHPSFLPLVVSDFHLNEGMVLPLHPIFLFLTVKSFSVFIYGHSIVYCTALWLAACSGGIPVRIVHRQYCGLFFYFYVCLVSYSCSWRYKPYDQA